MADRPGTELRVIAPVPYFPPFLPGQGWCAMRQVPHQEHIGKLKVYHPRYFLLPKVSMPVHGLLMFLGSVVLAHRLKKTFPFDCIDAHYVYPDGFAAILLGKIFRVPVLVTARGTDINLYPKFRLIRRMIQWTLRQAADVIAVSASLKEAMVGIGLARGKIQVIANGIDIERFSPMDREVARNLLGLPMRGKVLVCVGALVPVKGHQVLLNAFAKIVPQYPDARLYLIGEGAERTRLARLIRRLGMEDRIFLVGAQHNERLKLWFNAADLSCLASNREGWPNVVSESIACGTPVVATRVGGVPEIISCAELGVLTGQDEKALACATETALAKTWDRKLIAAHARARTWDTVAREVERFIAVKLDSAGRGHS